jgi:hypothetical protein
MKLQFILAFVSVFFFGFPLYAQLTPDALKDKAKNNKWYISGFDISASRIVGNNNDYSNNSDVVKLFDGLTQTGVAHNQFQFDYKTTNNFNRSFFTIRSNHIWEGNIELALKRKCKRPNGFMNYFEAKVGLSLAEQETYLDMYGDSLSGDTMNYQFRNTYSVVIPSFRVNAAISLKTPKIFGFLSFYTDVGVYAGKVFDMIKHADLSTLETTNIIHYSNTLKYYNSGNTAFDTPSLNVGASIPLGMSIHLSPSLKFKIGYLYNINTYLIKNKTVSAENKGFKFSISFDISNNGKRIVN